MRGLSLRPIFLKPKRFFIRILIINLITTIMILIINHIELMIFTLGGGREDIHGGAPKGGAPNPQNFALVFPSLAPIFIHSSLSWGSSRGILVVFLKRRGPEMCTFGVLGLLCEALAAPKPPPPTLAQTAKILRFFFLSRSQCRSFSLSGGTLVEFGNEQTRPLLRLVKKERGMLCWWQR